MDDDLFLSAKIDGCQSLCISSLSRKTFEECGGEVFGSDTGFFVYEQDDSGLGGVSVLAKVASLDAAYRLIELIGGIRLGAANNPIPSG